MRMKGASKTMLVAAAITLCTAVSAGEFPVVGGSTVKMDGQEIADARAYADTDRTFYYVTVPGDKNVYRVNRKGKTVSALRRSSVLVKADKCRPIEGAEELPISGHLYQESAQGFSFNTLGGKTVSVSLPR